MKKYIYYVVTSLAIISLCTSIILKGTHHSFNSSNVKKNIDEISSPKYSGRLTGSNENYDLANIIKTEFQNAGLVPLEKDYLEGFQVQAPYRNETPPALKITNEQETIKNFDYGIDFKEDLLNFKDSSIKFSNSDNISINSNSITIERNLTTYVFYVNKDKAFSFRSSFVSSSPYGFAIAITTDTYNYILNSLRSGYLLEVSLPYNIKTQEVFNVAGKIKGKDSSLPPLVLTAHFDHLGVDPLGNCYGGALDNASGTAFLLELIKSFKTLPKPNRDIIFVALNAEEFGLLGSKNFAESHKDLLKDSEVINFDMVGVQNFPVTFMMPSSMKDKDSKLLSSLINVAKTKSIKYDEKFEDSSDHSSFGFLGIDSLTVSHSDVSRIHTPNDTVDNISTKGLDEVFNLVNSKLLNSAYNNPLFIFYDDKMLIFSSLLTFALVSIGVIYKKKQNKDKSISL